MAICQVFGLFLALALFNAVHGDDCITTITLFTLTSDASNSQSNGDFYLNLKYITATGETDTISYHLYDLLGNDMQQTDGNMWEFNSPSSCLTLDDIKSMSITANTNNGWRIETALTYGTTSGLIQITNDYEANAWVDNSMVPPDGSMSLHTDTVEPDNCVAAPQCIRRMLISTMTGDDNSAGTNDWVRFTLKSSQTNLDFKLYNRPGDDYEKHQGDQWDYLMSDLYSGCITFKSVYEVAFVADGKDAWLIADAFVTVQLDSDKWTLLAGDSNIYKWIEKNNLEKVNLSLRNNCDSTAEKAEL